MTANEQRFLTKQLRHSNCYLEYGSGNSTRLAVENSNIRNITSVESDRQFWQMLIESDRKLLKAVEEKRLNPLLVNIGKTTMWGYPADDSCREHWPAYALAPFMSRKDYDLILIDGRFRIACTLQSCIHTPAGTKIMIHDFYNRPCYHIVLLFLKEIQRVDTFGLFTVRHDNDENLIRRIIRLYEYAPDC